MGMIMRKIYLIIPLIILILFLSLTIKRAPYKEWEGDTNPFATETFLAAESFLQKHVGEKKVTKLKHWAEFKPDQKDQHQLLVIFRQNIKTQDAQDKLLKWVAQGNHLVIPMEYNPLELNPFLMKTSEEEDRDTEGLAALPLSAALNIGYAPTEEDRVKDKKEEGRRESFDDLNDDGESDDYEQERSLENEWYKNLSAQPLQKVKNIDDQTPALVCIDALKDRIKALEQETNNKDVLPLSKIYSDGQTIGALKKTLDASQETLAISKVGASAGQAGYQKQRMLNELVLCSENIVRLRLSDDKEIELLIEANKKSIIYLGKSPLLLEGSNTYGRQIIRIPYEEGSITVLSPTAMKLFADPRLPTYDVDSISQFDHAYFLAYLAQNKNKVLLLERADDVKVNTPKPSLLKAMYKHSPELLLVLIIFMILFSWSKIRREGPILASLNISRRNLREHFRAQGAFLRRHANSSSTIVYELQNDIWYRAQKRLPNIRMLAPEQKRKELSRLTGLKESEVTILLMPVKDRISTLELVRYIIALQKIRNNL